MQHFRIVPPILSVYGIKLNTQTLWELDTASGWYSADKHFAKMSPKVRHFFIYKYILGK